MRENLNNHARNKCVHIICSSGHSLFNFCDGHIEGYGQGHYNLRIY